MTRRKVTYGAACLVLLALGSFLWARGMLAVGNLSTSTDFLFSYDEPASLSPSSRWNLEDEEDLYVLVRETGDIPVKAPLLERSENLLLLETLGNPGLTLPAGSLESGSYPTSSEECALDRETALSLWGDAQVVGHMVTIDSQEYTVTGVFLSPTPMLILPHSLKEEFVFSHGVYRPMGDNPYPRQELDAFISRQYLPSPSKVTESVMQNGLTGIIARIPPWMLLFVLAGYVLRGFFPPEGKKWRTTRRILWALLLVFAIWQLDVIAFVSPEVLPARWSDFSAWSDQFRKLGDTFTSGWLSSGTVVSLVRMRMERLPIYLYAGGSAFCYAMAASWARRRVFVDDYLDFLYSMQLEHV